MPESPQGGLPPLNTTLPIQRLERKRMTITKIIILPKNVRATEQILTRLIARLVRMETRMGRICPILNLGNLLRKNNLPIVRVMGMVKTGGLNNIKLYPID